MCILLLQLLCVCVRPLMSLSWSGHFVFTHTITGWVPTTSLSLSLSPCNKAKRSYSAVGCCYEFASYTGCCPGEREREREQKSQDWKQPLILCMCMSELSAPYAAIDTPSLHQNRTLFHYIFHFLILARVLSAQSAFLPWKELSLLFLFLLLFFSSAGQFIVRVAKIHLISLRLVFSAKQKQATVAEEFWLGSCFCVFPQVYQTSGRKTPPLSERPTSPHGTAVFVFRKMSVLTGCSFIENYTFIQLILIKFDQKWQ